VELTASEVLTIYNGGTLKVYTVLDTPTSGAAAAAWNMNEGTGNHIHDEINGLVGTFTGGVTWPAVSAKKSLIKEVATAFHAKYETGTALVAALPGGLYFMKAPENVTFPFGVCTWNGTTIDEICGGQSERIEHITFIVSLFSNADDGGFQVFNIVDEFTHLFDWCELSYTDFSHVACKRNTITNIGMLDNVIQIDIEYELIISHS